MADQGRIFNLGATAPGYQDHRQTMLGQLSVAEVEPKYYELARAGLIFGITHTVATAIVPLQVFPTTTAGFVVNNVSTDGSLLVPLKIGISVGSGTAGAGASLGVGVTPSALATQLTADGAGVVHKSLRDAGKVPTAYMDFAKAVVAPVYSIIGVCNHAAVATVGGGGLFDCDGLFVVKPTFALAGFILSGAGTSAAYCISVTYAMIPNTTALP